MKRTFAAPRPLDLRRTVAALGMKASGVHASSAGEVMWASRTPEGPASLHLAAVDGRIEAQAWGRGAEWMLEAAPGLVGAHDRPEDFEPGRGLIRRLHLARQGLRVGRTRRVYEAALPAVLGQKVTNQEARLAGSRLVRRYGEPAPGPGDLRLFPDPALLRGLSYWDLHPLGIERKRADILFEVARRSSRLEEIVGMDEKRAYERLTAIRGIGPWTAGHVMGIAWGDPDAVPVGDFHLPNTVSWALAGEDRASDERMLELLEPYRGHRRRLLLLLKCAGIKAPKYGPRLAVRSIEGI